MSALFSYSIAVSLVTLLLFPVLNRLINRSTYFCFNRAATIIAMLLALATPYLVTFDIIRFDSNEGILSTTDAPAGIIARNIASVGSVSVQPEAQSNFSWIAIAVGIYCAGILLLLLRELISFIRLFQIIAKSEKRVSDGHTVCCLDDSETAPFSWGKYIFIQKKDFEGDCTSILLHEEAHTDKRHWLDVLFTDMFCILLWYNPFAWMIRQLLKLNHEFEADAAVIESGVDTYSYQRMLVTKAMGKKAMTMTNSLAASKGYFHKRVMKMSKVRSSRKTKLLALCIAPAVFAAWLIISSPVSAGLLSSISDFKFQTEREEEIALPYMESKTLDIEEAIEDEMPEENADTLIILPSPLKDQKELYDIIRLSLSTIEPDKDTKINIGIVVDEEGRVAEVVTDNKDNSLVNLIIDKAVNGIRFEQITQDGKPIQTRFNIPVVIKKK